MQRTQELHIYMQMQNTNTIQMNSVNVFISDNMTKYIQSCA